jgi:hypothetical protein
MRRTISRWIESGIEKAFCVSIVVEIRDSSREMSWTWYTELKKERHGILPGTRSSHLEQLTQFTTIETHGLFPSTMFIQRRLLHQLRFLGQITTRRHNLAF